jgi:hypothetical protein
MKKWCLTWFAVYALVAVCLAIWFFVRFPEAPPNVSPRLPPVPMRAAGAAGWGLVCAIPAFLGLAGLEGIRMRLGERTRLQAAAAGAPPRDGEVGPFVGRMVASRAQGQSQTLTAPLSGRQCLLYHYQASHTSGGKSASQVTDAEGYALAPSAIETLTGLVELRAYVDLEFTPDLFEDEPSRERLSAYQRTATLFQPTANLMRNYRESESYLLDDDGAIRYDHGIQGSADESTSFVEHVVRHGDEVVVFGLYSAVRGAVVPDPQSEVLHRARLLKGGVGRVARRLTRQAIVSGIAGVAFLAGTAGLVYLFFEEAATYFI